MASQTLLALTGAAPAVGSIVAFAQADNIRVLQFNPRPGVVFSGSVVVEGSYVASPGNNDFQTLATVTFTNHAGNFSMDVESDAPWVRVRLTVASVGEIAVFGTSRSGLLTGGQGVALVNATAVVNSPLKVGVTGAGVHVAAPVQPAFSSDDVVYALDVSKTVTDKIDELETTVGSTTASVPDLDVLTGAATAGVTPADIQKLACITVGCAEINNVSGASGNLQTQIDGKAAGAGVDITGWSTDVSWVNTFFDGAPTITVSALSAALGGLTATAADLNVFTATAGTFTNADMAKLGNITASAAEINALAGFTGTSTDLNKVVGLTASNADLDAVAGYAGTGVTATEIGYLSGLTQNVQAGLNAATALVGLTADVGDLNLLTGAATGTGAYAGAITATEISYLDGVTSNIQNQLNNRRLIGVSIGIAEISGASITTTELNYLSGASANIQAQIDAIAGASIGVSGGTFLAPICVDDGSDVAPGLGFASECTSGLYLAGAKGIGFAANGARVGAFDDASYNWHVGRNTTNGEPVMRGTGFGEANPAYTFHNNLDLGLYWDALDVMGVSAGGQKVAEFGASKVALGGALVNNVELEVTAMDGIEKLIARATVQAGQISGSTGTTSLYTVPAGREVWVTKIALRLLPTTLQGGSAGDVSTVTGLQLNLGFLTPEWDEFADNVNNPQIWNPEDAGTPGNDSSGVPTPGLFRFDTSGQIIWAGLGDNPFWAIAGSGGADYQVATPGQQITANVVTLADFDHYDIEIAVFGYEKASV